MFRIKVGEQSYTCSDLPAVKGANSVEAALAACAPSEDQVSGFYWNASNVQPGSDIIWGLGGVDELIATQRDLSACCALSDAVMERLRMRGAFAEPSDFANAVGLVARDPSVNLAYCSELSGQLGGRQVSPMEHGAVTEEITSILIPLHHASEQLDDILDEIVAQTYRSRVEVVLVSCGVDAEVHQRAKDKVAGLRNRSMRLRVFNLAGSLALSYLVDVGVALAASRVVVVVDPHCRFTRPTSLQKLADWAAGGDVLTVCPAIQLNNGDRMYGLSATTAQRPELTPYFGDALGLDIRLTAAPTPWTFALNRSSWLSRGGVRGGAGGVLWTSPLAYTSQGGGRNILLADEVVALTERELAPARLKAPLREALSPQANKAIRVVVSEEADEPLARLVRRRLPTLTSSLAPSPLRASFPLPPLESGEGVGDAPVADSRLRLLVFADMFAASQAILFEEGLQQARRRGEVTVRIVEEQALDAATLDAAVQRHIQETQANIVVLSRLGSMPLIEAVSRTAKARGVALMAHLDDDLLDLPVSAGIERYRKARNPRRIQAMLEGLSCTEAVLVSTPELAQRLAPIAGLKLKPLRFGVAGAPSRPRATSDEALVIGYMGSASHDADLAMIAPALNAVRRDHPQVRLELLGSIAEQPSVTLLDGAVAKRGGMIRNYGEFKAALAELHWDIGLAPLRPVAFNTVKTPAKWVEYAEAGVVAIVSDMEPYRAIIDAGAAFSAAPDEWEVVLRRAIEDPSVLPPVQAKADRLLTETFSWEQLEAELLAIFTASTAVEAAA